MKRYRDITGDGGSRIIEQVTEKMSRLNKRMADVKYKVAVMSGKGGVGKSTVTAMLAAAMAKQGFHVGILDADLNGPSIPKMFGIEDVVLKHDESAALPAEGALGVKVMSMEFLLPQKGAQLAWNGPSATYPWVSTIEATALRELLSDTEWGKLDFLFIDMPPVLSRLNDLSGLIPDLSGVIMVTIPSEISQLIVLKSINRVKELNLRIIGMIENMKGYTCIHCGGENNLFSDEDKEEVFAYLQVPYLGKVPFDSQLSSLSNAGLANSLKNGKDLPLSEIFDNISKKIIRSIKS